MRPRYKSGAGLFIKVRPFREDPRKDWFSIQQGLAFFDTGLWITAKENNAKKAYPQRFLGFEAEADAQWIYLEIPITAEELKKANLRNQVLVETFADQTNLTNIDINGQKRTHIFKEGEVLKPLL